MAYSLCVLGRGSYCHRPGSFSGSFSPAARRRSGRDRRSGSVVIQALSQKMNRQNEVSPASGWVWPERGAQPSGGSSQERRCQTRWVGHLIGMPPGRLSLELFWARLSGDCPGVGPGLTSGITYPGWPGSAPGSPRRSG